MHRVIGYNDRRYERNGEEWAMGDVRITSEKGQIILAQVREICMRLPEVHEAVDSFGHTSFRVKDKPFVMMGEKAEDTSISIKTLKTTQEVLLQREGFVKTPYIGQHGWVSLTSIDQADWQEIEELIKEGYLRTAPKSLAKLVTL
jgi:predicted DNA-binding protein (MmcQ/YjbR family)